MSTNKIDYRILLNRDGESQPQRKRAALQPSFAPVDAKSEDEYFEYIKQVAAQIKFFNKDDNSQQGTWKEFFDYSKEELEQLARENNVPPHVALMLTFLKLQKFPQELLNGITKRHLDFYYNNVLKLQHQPSIPDKAHVIFELKKGTLPQLLKTGTLLRAGKDKTGKELSYELTHDIVVNASKVEALKSVLIDVENKNAIHIAPVSNSADGLGKKIEGDEKKWNAFGNKFFPNAAIGFCLASPVLLMAEGTRTVSVKIIVSGLQLSLQNSIPATLLQINPVFQNQNIFSNLFKVALTGEKGWIDAQNISPEITTDNNKNSVINFSFTLTEKEQAVVNYDATKHGSNYETLSPMLQIIINNEKTNFGYDALKNSKLLEATIDVDVKGIRSLDLENDLGKLNAKKPFHPFGIAPGKGSNFEIGYEEAFTKKLKNFSFDVEWKNIPDSNLASYYSGYSPAVSSNAFFSAGMQIRDAGGWEQTVTTNLFNNTNAKSGINWNFQNPAFSNFKPMRLVNDLVFHKFQTTHSNWTKKASSDLRLSNLHFDIKTVLPLIQLRNLFLFAETPALKRGFIRMRLNTGFLHKEFREQQTKRVIETTMGLRRDSEGNRIVELLKEPIAPEIQSFILNYTATSGTVNFVSETLEDFIDNDIEFFQVGAFGQMREHAYQRNQFKTFIGDNRIPLLHQYRNEGELYIGISGINAGDAVLLLMQVAEGSANPDIDKIDLSWSVLCDNYWKELSDYDFIFDTTNDLLTSGVVKIILPQEATTGNTILPEGFIWLRIAAQINSDAICKLIDVKCNAAIAQFKDDGNDATHLSSALPAQTISKLTLPFASVKKTEQPYASFGGAMAENDEKYNTRISERLRHKQRAITLWDYEHIILQQFPKVFKVKCINHASASSFYEPGHVSLVVVPDLTNTNAIDPFQPKVDKNTIDEISKYLLTKTNTWVQLHVMNPLYETVKVSAGIRLHKGFEFNYYQNEITQRLIKFLSPWAFGRGDEIHFGGKIHKSTVLKFLEDMEFVDFVTDLQLFQSFDGGINFRSDAEFIEASTPRSVLVSHINHEINSI